MSEDRALLLYGSHARGDADPISDIDVLCVGQKPPCLGEVERRLPESCEGILHTSHYTWEELEAMGRYGSLFLQHISTEAKALLYEGNAQRRLSALLSDLRPYQLAARDLLGFRVTVSDVRAGLAAGLSPSYELAVLGGVARHASVLTCYVAGVPTFGRKSIARAADLLRIRPQEDLQLAHLFRLFEEGQCQAPKEVNRAVVEDVLAVLAVFLDRLESMIHANAA
jgi:hypothetical protein